MIPKPQFLSYFQAKTGEVGLRLLDWTNILPHLSVCGVDDILDEVEFHFDPSSAECIQLHPLQIARRCACKV